MILLGSPVRYHHFRDQTKRVNNAAAAHGAPDRDRPQDYLVMDRAGRVTISPFSRVNFAKARSNALLFSSMPSSRAFFLNRSSRCLSALARLACRLKLTATLSILCLSTGSVMPFAAARAFPARASQCVGLLV